MQVLHAKRVGQGEVGGIAFRVALPSGWHVHGGCCKNGLVGPGWPNSCLGCTNGLRNAIGACRAVWVPGQDLATPHLMRNCGKCILSLHCTLYVHLCTHMLDTGDHMSSHPVLVI